MKDIWRLEYDSTLNQHYYVNSVDNLISFDLPDEVKRHNKFTNVFRRRSTGSSLSSASSCSSLTPRKRPMCFIKRTFSLNRSPSRESTRSARLQSEKVLAPAPLEVTPSYTFLRTPLSFALGINDECLIIEADMEDTTSIDSKDYDVNLFDAEYAHNYYVADWEEDKPRDDLLQERLDLRMSLWREIN